LDGLPLAWTLEDETIIISRSAKENRKKGSVTATPVIQQITVRGRVADESGTPLSGATVAVKGTSVAATTDDSGNYSIAVPGQGGTLVFTMVGFDPQEVPISGQSTINVTMRASVSDLDEVVVVGYGTMRKSDLTGSVAQVKAEDIQAVPVYNMEQALKGRAAGVQVTQNSGQPGGRIEVRVRGGNSMIGNNQPLYVVDG